MEFTQAQKQFLLTLRPGNETERSDLAHIAGKGSGRVIMTLRTKNLVEATKETVALTPEGEFERQKLIDEGWKVLPSPWTGLPRPQRTTSKPKSKAKKRATAKPRGKKTKRR